MLDQPAIISLVNSIQEQLERLRRLLQQQTSEFDTRDPRNKLPDGKLSARGVEICYRLFDSGKTRYAIKEAMEISFGAATHRLEAWQKAGGVNRQKVEIE
jgi:hypothetical protein